MNDRPELEIVELEERLEFGTALIDSDLSADVNSMCANGSGCPPPNSSCSNVFACSGG